MHRFQSKSTLSRFRLAAVLLCSKYLLVPITVGLLIYAVSTNDKKLVLTAIGVGGLTVGVVILQWLISNRTRCPLCLTPVLASKNCSKHRNARTLLGSYRLRAAVAVLFKGSFRCPYCYESTAMEVRARPSYSNPGEREISRNSRG